MLEEARRRKANAAFLEVRSANLAAQALYEKSGFRAIARRAELLFGPARRCGRDDSESGVNYQLDLSDLLGYHFSVRHKPNGGSGLTSKPILPTFIRLKGDMHEHGHRNHG